MCSKRRKEEVQNVFKPTPIYFTFHLHHIAVFIKMHLNNIYAAIEHDGNESFAAGFLAGCCAPTIPTGSRSCFDTLRTKPSRKTNLVRLEFLPDHRASSHTSGLNCFSHSPPCDLCRHDAVHYLCGRQGIWSLSADDGRKGELLRNSSNPKRTWTFSVLLFLIGFFFFSQKPKSTRKNWNGTPSFCWSTLITRTKGFAEWLTNISLAWLRR